MYSFSGDSSGLRVCYRVGTFGRGEVEIAAAFLLLGFSSEGLGEERVKDGDMYVCSRSRNARTFRNRAFSHSLSIKSLHPFYRPLCVNESPRSHADKTRYRREDEWTEAPTVTSPRDFVNGTAIIDGVVAA
jgi:hypothetical protein